MSYNTKTTSTALKQHAYIVAQKHSSSLYRRYEQVGGWIDPQEPLPAIDRTGASVPPRDLGGDTGRLFDSWYLDFGHTLCWILHQLIQAKVAGVPGRTNMERSYVLMPYRPVER